MDKIKQVREKYPFLDFLAGFVPGVGEAQDVHDFSIAAKKNDYMGMGLASLGLLTPLSGRQISAFIRPQTRSAFTDWARKTLEQMHIIRPRLAEAIKEGNPRALKIKENLEKVAKDKFHVMEKSGYVEDVNPEHFIIPKDDARGYYPTPETMMEAGMNNLVTTSQGKLFSPNYIVGVKGTTGTDLLIPGRAATKIVRDKFGHETVVKLGQFTSDDIITALYYSGHGKVRSSNAIYKAIDTSDASKLAKDYAKEQLANIENILQKYAKDRGRNPQMFLANGKAGWGRDLKDASKSKVDKGMIPAKLEHPTNEDELLDRMSLEESLNNLSRWFGAGNSNGVTEFFQKVPRDTFVGSYGGQNWGNFPGFDMVAIDKRIKPKNQDDLAKFIADSKDRTLGIIQDIKDGAGKSTDIIMQPNQYTFKIYKKGGRFILTTRNREER